MCGDMNPERCPLCRGREPVLGERLAQSLSVYGLLERFYIPFGRNCFEQLQKTFFKEQGLS